MQPYFFPYMGYFQLMSCVDKWVVFDQIQFINKGWVNRNRILHLIKTKYGNISRFHCQEKNKKTIYQIFLYALM